LLQFGGLAVNEFRAELDRARYVRRCDREDAAADAIAGFEDFDVNTRLMERTCGGNTCRTRTDHNDHETKS
jgi:hypothetical protein